MKLSKRIGLALGCVAPIIVSTSFAISSCGNQPVVHTVKAINRSGKMNFNGVKGIASGAKTNEEFVLKFDDKTIEPNELTYSLTNCSTDRIQISPGGIISWSTDIEANTYNFNVVITYVAKDGKEYTATSENVKVVIVDGQIIATSTDLVQSGAIGKTAGSFNLQLGGEVTVADEWTATAASMSQNPFSIVDGTNGKTLTWNTLLVEGVYNITITATKDSVNYSIDVKLTIEDLLITGLDTIYGDINGEDSPKQYKFGAQFFDEDVDATFSLVEDLGQYGINMSGNGILSWDTYGYDGTVTVKAEYEFADITFVSTKVINLKLDNASLVDGTTNISIDEPGESWPKEGVEPDPWKLMFGSIQMTTGVSFSVVESLPQDMTFDIDVNGLISITNAQPGTYHIKATWGGTCLNVVSPTITIKAKYYDGQLRNAPTDLTVYNNHDGSLSTSLQFICNGFDEIENQETEIWFTGDQCNSFSFDRGTRTISWDSGTGHFYGPKKLILHAKYINYTEGEEYEDQVEINLHLVGADVLVWNGQDYVYIEEMGMGFGGDYGYVYDSNVFGYFINGEPATLESGYEYEVEGGGLNLYPVDETVHLFYAGVDYDVAEPEEAYVITIIFCCESLLEEYQVVEFGVGVELTSSPEYKLFGPFELNAFSNEKNCINMYSSPFEVYKQCYPEAITTGYELVVTNPDGADFTISNNRLHWTKFEPDTELATCTVGVKPDDSDDIYCQEEVTLTRLGEIPMPYNVDEEAGNIIFTLGEEAKGKGGTLCLADLSAYGSLSKTKVIAERRDGPLTGCKIYWDGPRLMYWWSDSTYAGDSMHALFSTEWQFNCNGVLYVSNRFMLEIDCPYLPE